MINYLYTILILLMAASCHGADAPTKVSPPVLAVNEPQGSAFFVDTDVSYESIPQANIAYVEIINLTLSPTGEANMTTNYLDQSPMLTDRGRWVEVGDSSILLHLLHAGDSDTVVLSFKRHSESLVYTGGTYGTVGLTLKAKPVSVNN